MQALNPLLAKAGFALWCAGTRWTSSKACPHCGSSDSEFVGAKILVMQVLRCRDCRLEYRFPPDTVTFNRRFYQRSYRCGFTTDLPGPQELEELKQLNFSGTSKDWSTKIALVKRFCQGTKLLGYGSSWGYALYQFEGVGYEVQGYEISEPRAQYGRKKLGVQIHTQQKALNSCLQQFDIVHTSHVLEHLPSLRGVFEMLFSLLKPEGHLVVFVPNCGSSEALANGVRWGPYSGKLHPLSFRKEFFLKNLPRYGFADVRALSSPYVFDRPGSPDHSTTWNALGPELCVVATRPS